jgi:hypothetical protein
LLQKRKEREKREKEEKKGKKRLWVEGKEESIGLTPLLYSYRTSP